MRDPRRIKRILKKLEKLWMESPDLRLCQLIINLLGSRPNDIFYVEDDIIERLLNKLYPYDDAGNR